ncbi:hypothetical protein D3C72_2002540 [compost metagenome]
MKMVAGLGADEFHQLVGVAELARSAVAAGQVAAQGDDTPHAGRLEVGQHGADRFARTAHARQMRCGLFAGRQDLAHGVQGTLLRRTAGAKRHREILWMQLRQLDTRGAQLFRPFRGFRREKLNTEIMLFHRHYSKVRSTGPRK